MTDICEIIRDARKKGASDILLFVLDGENGALLGAVVLLPEDERWDGQPLRRARMRTFPWRPRKESGSV